MYIFSVNIKIISISKITKKLTNFRKITSQTHLVEWDCYDSLFILDMYILIIQQNYTKMRSNTTSPSEFSKLESLVQPDRFKRANCNHRPNSTLHIKDKKFKRKKRENNIFNIVNRILNDNTKQAFLRLLCYSNYHNRAQQQTYSCQFSQNWKENLNFPEQIKKQKIQSYIHFKTYEYHNYSSNVHKLINLLSKFEERRKSYAILQMNRHFEESRYKINQMTVLSGLKETTQASQVFKSDVMFYQTPQKPKNVRISYLKVKINNQEQLRNSEIYCPDSDKKQVKYISIRNIQKSKGKKQYEFRSLDNKLIKMNRKSNCIF